MMYLKYLWYVIRHKWYVMVECFRMGIYWRGLTHDLSKFLPSEFIPYARNFYGKYLSFDQLSFDARQRGVRTKEDVKRDFKEAWLKHQHRNPHHWQYWILQNDTDGRELMVIPTAYLKEMVADWIGAGRAITGKREAISWYKKSKDKIVVHHDMIAYIEFFLNKYAKEEGVSL